jgi:glycosyltransferase involved in cell wall biosynthesis
VVVEALRKACLPNVDYTLFGPITQPYVRELRAIADRVPGLNFHTYGSYNPESLPSLLAGVDAVIVPSLVWETFSIVAREAFACGVPVIASRLGALPEAIREGQNGLLFAPGDSSELAAVLQRLDRDRDRLDRLRSGIRPDDWISVLDRTRRLEGLLQKVHAEGVQGRHDDARLAELGALRALLG